jgi:16S rRNA (cytosine967-C5)-methyltransferase
MTAARQSAAARTAPKNRPAEVSPARKAAFKVLLAVERGPSHSDDLLRGKAVDALSAPDRNLATALVLGVLRWQIRLDRQLRDLLKRPHARLDPEIRIALRLGAFQILHMDRIPARAAIDESVELAKQAGHRFASGMVNAVLRKLAGAPQVDFSEATTEELALAYAHPAWMVERWAGFYGLEAARALCRHGQSQPSLTLRIEAPAVEDELAAAGIRLQAGELLAAARTVVSGDLTASTAFRQGRLRLQDEGSQLIAELASCARANPRNAEMRILDACAAPGNKTLILAERNSTARIVACESSPQRFEPLRQRLAPLGDRVECRLIDSTALGEDCGFDLALVDAPCSGTGTLGRNPEIRHRLRPEDLTRQAERQRALLLAALRAVRPGGRVLYSTCSLEPEENEQVVAAALAEIPDARQVSLESRIDALLGQAIFTLAGADRLKASLTPEGALRLLPGALPTDGFFVCLLERAVQ